MKGKAARPPTAPAQGELRALANSPNEIPNADRKSQSNRSGRDPTQEGTHKATAVQETQRKKEPAKQPQRKKPNANKKAAKQEAPRGQEAA